MEKDYKDRTVEIVLENCESFIFKMEDISMMKLANISVQLCGAKPYKEVGTFVLGIRKEADPVWYDSFSDTKWSERLKLGDITHIVLHYDGKEDQYVVAWDDDDWEKSRWQKWGEGDKDYYEGSIFYLNVPETNK